MGCIPGNHHYCDWVVSIYAIYGFLCRVLARGRDLLAVRIDSGRGAAGAEVEKVAARRRLPKVKKEGQPYGCPTLFALLISKRSS